MEKQTLKREPFMSAKISVLKSNLFDNDKINELLNLSFEEILVKLDESEFKITIDKLYGKYSGFYLIEKIINDYLSKISQKIIKGVSNENKEFIESFEFNSQIENFLVLLRIKHLNLNEDIDLYLKGSENKKKIFIEAVNFSKVEDVILFVSKKLGLHSKKILEIYNRNFFQLENYLYKHYYRNLMRNVLKISYNNRDEKIFINFLRRQIDILNIRTVLFLSEIDDVKKKEELFENLYTYDAKIKFEKLKNVLVKNEKVGEKLLIIANNIHPKLKIEKIEDIDKLKVLNLNLLLTKFRAIKFSSPFYPIKYLFELRQNLEKIKIILKAKQIKLDKKEIGGLISLGV
jgi:hypothetical protein